MTRPFPLHEPMECSGLWWMPDDPDRKISGTLTFNQQSGVALSLIGVFGDPSDALASAMDNSTAYKTIHGISTDGKSITLLRALRRESQFSFPGMMVESYLAVWALVGGHFESEDVAIFSESRVSFEGLDAWLAWQPFTMLQQVEPPRVTVLCEPSKDEVLGRVEQLSADVVATMNLHFHHDRIRRVEAVSESGIGLRCDTPQTLQWHIEQAARLNRLAALCTGRHLPFTRVRLLGAPYEIAPGLYKPQAVDVLMRMNGEPPSTTPPQDPPIYSVAELLRDNPGVIEKWFDVSDKLEPTLDLFFTYLSNYKLYAEVAFLLLIQSLEVFHRSTSSETHMPRTDYDALKTLLLKAIPTNTPTGMRQKLRSTLDFANEPSLRQRLKRTIATLEPAFGGDPFGFDKLTITKTVDSRNYYTHYPYELKNKALSGVKLQQLTKKFVPLLFTLLLARIELPMEQIRIQLGRRSEFAQTVGG